MPDLSHMSGYTWLADDTVGGGAVRGAGGGGTVGGAGDQAAHYTFYQ
jgi:hypothetical protein